jgi:hypothetical protein
MSTTTLQSIRPTTGGLGRSRALGVAGAVLADVAVWALAVPILGISLVVHFGNSAPQGVGLPAVVGGSLVLSLLGLALLVTLERVSRSARAIWTIVALIALGASLGLPLVAAATQATLGVLALMHVAAGGVLIPALRRR